jgi:hypothetical protein
MVVTRPGAQTERQERAESARLRLKARSPRHRAALPPIFFVFRFTAARSAP